MATKELTIILKASDQLSAVTGQAALRVSGSLDLIHHKAESTKQQVEGLGASLKELGKSLGEKVWDILKAPGDSFLVEGIKKAIEGSVDQVTGTGSIAKRLGLSEELAGELGHVARMRGEDFAGLAQAVATFEKNLVQFSEFGTGRAKEAFELLERDGLKLKGTYQDLGTILPKLADAFARMSPERAQFESQRLFGDGAQGILKLLRGGGDALSRGFAEAHELGVVFTPDQIERAHEFELATRRLSEAFLGVKAAIAGEVEPVLTAFLNAAAAGISALPEKVRLVRDLFKDLFSPEEGARGHANERLVEMLDATGTYIVGTLKATGTFAGEAFWAAFMGVAAAAQGKFADFVQDSMAGIFGSHDSMAKSMVLPGGQTLSDWAKGNRSEVTIMQEKIEAQRKLTDAIKERIAIQAEAVEEERRLEGPTTGASIEAAKLQQELTRADNQLKALERGLAIYQEDRTRAATASLKKSGEDLEASVARYRAAISALQGPLASAFGRQPGDPAVEGRTEADEAEHERLKAAAQARAREQAEAFWHEAALAEGRASGEEFDALLHIGKLVQQQRLSVLAANDPRGAERQRILESVESQMGALDPAKLRGTYAAAAAAVQQWGDAQLHAFDGETKVQEVLRESQGVYEDYREQLEGIAEQLQSGQIQKFQAARMDQQAADATRALAKAERERLDALKAEFPELSDLIDKSEKEVSSLIARIGLARQERPETFLQGVEQGLREFREKLDDVGERGRQAFLTVAESAETHLADALFAAGTNFKNLGQVARQALQGIVADIGHVASQLASQEILRGLFSALASGGGGGGFSSIPWLAPRAAGGAVAAGGMYLVGEEGPEILAMGRGGGGFVYSGRGRGGGGGAWGGGGGGATIVVQQTNTFNAGITPEHAEAVKQASIAGVAEAIERNPTYRGRVNRGLS